MSHGPGNPWAMTVINMVDSVQTIGGEFPKVSFVITGPRAKGRRVLAGRYEFINGVCEVDIRYAQSVGRILTRFYGAKMRFKGDLTEALLQLADVPAEVVSAQPGAESRIDATHASGKPGIEAAAATAARQAGPQATKTAAPAVTAASKATVAR